MIKHFNPRIFWGCCVLASGVLSAQAGHAQEVRPIYPVEFDSLESKGLFSSEALKITGHVAEAGAAAGVITPGAVFAPACGGLMRPKDQKRVRAFYRRMARHLQSMGVTTVMVDGFGPRGEKEICSQRATSRTMDEGKRMEDSYAGLKYLRGRKDIDTNRIFLFTWGAAGGFPIMSTGSSEVAKVGGGFAAAVMLYPQCNNVAPGFSAYAPIQVFAGEKDTWNPPASCLSLAQQKDPGSATIDVKVYPDSYHGFDHPTEPREIYIKSKGGNMMVGGNPKARDDAYQRIAVFLARFIGR